MKEAVTKVIDTLTQEDFNGALQKLLKRYNKCIAAGGDYFEGGQSFMCVLSIKVPMRKKSGNLFNHPRISFVAKTKIISDDSSFMVNLTTFPTTLMCLNVSAYIFIYLDVNNGV